MTRMLSPFSFLVGSLALLCSVQAYAGAACSGGSGVGHTGFGMSNFAYDRGKAAYKGRTVDGRRMRYCVMIDGNVERVRRSTLKQFRSASLESLAYALVDCDNPDALALTQIDPKRVPFVLTYLSQHYNLRLRSKPREALTPDQDTTIASAH